MNIEFDICWLSQLLKPCIASEFKLSYRMNSLRELFVNLSLGKQLLSTKNQLPIASLERFYKYAPHDNPTPKPGAGKQFRRYVIMEYRLGVVIQY